MDARVDNDGLPDVWEAPNGLTVGVNDAALDLDNDGLSSVQEYWLGLSANDNDSDNDTLSDGLEVTLHGTNPLSQDTDNDGLPDTWEITGGLDPLRDDRNEDRDFDFVSNLNEYNGGVASTNPNSPDSDSNGITDYQQRNGGKSTWQALYDRNDRLLGVRHERGASFSYRYDGNSNITRQVKLGRDSDGDGLPDAWEFANRLDPHSANGINGFGGDADGDGWSNFQEFLAGSDASAASGASSTPGVNGIGIGSITMPFTPTNFVSATGQLDGGGAAEIVVGANGDPGNTPSFIRICKESGTSWTFEDVPIGTTPGESAYGVTSIAIGQVTGRRPAIYLGLRKTGGTGRVVELSKSDAGTWQRTVIVEGVTDTAHVHGLRTTSAGTDLMLGLAPRFGSAGALYRAVFEDAVWKVGLVESATGTRHGAVTGQKRFRLLSNGGIQITSPRTYMSLDEFTGTGAILNPPWTTGGGVNPSQDGSVGSLAVSWNSSAGNVVSSSMETTLLWPNNANGIDIRLASAEYSQGGTNFGGNTEVVLGASQIYAAPRNGGPQTGVQIQVVRAPGQMFSRWRIGNGTWDPWSPHTSSELLKFMVSGRDIGSNSAGGTATMQVDYVRYQTISQMLAAGASANDVPASGLASGSAYRSASNTWYFKTPALTWMDSSLQPTPTSARSSQWIQWK